MFSINSKNKLIHERFNKNIPLLPRTLFVTDSWQDIYASVVNKVGILFAGRRYLVTYTTEIRPSGSSQMCFKHSTYVPTTLGIKDNWRDTFCFLTARQKYMGIRLCSLHILKVICKEMNLLKRERS